MPTKHCFQFSLFEMKSKKIFGGSLLKKSNAKEKRPISTKHAMHIVLRSSHAHGHRSFLKRTHSRAIDKILKGQARRWGIRLYRYENVGNHLHILLKTGHRKWLQGYLRSITGLIARMILGAQRGHAKLIRFWDGRPFSRIVAWGKAYMALHRYFDKNQLEALGFDLSALAATLKTLQANTS